MDEAPLPRCGWCEGDPEYQRYHDEEWGVPQRDDQRLFEKVCLEGFQCGLSWITILKRRDAFRECFAEFDPLRLAEFSASDVKRLMRDARIIRNRAKIEAAIHNAGRMRCLMDEHVSLGELLWQFKPERDRAFAYADEIPAITDESRRMSKELKRRGWKFVGPTTCYALMQATGIVNDHVVGCWRYPIIQAM
ncbi:DNA-3-methyladenine glycosylase I [Rhodopirellula sp. JC740]|uniref:DNA-3-methyladenine glycosylase I n=1 Tax=Rhodopirellula halodulae TaxID=2894198 RepID=A0ABS8NP18_9BACT|nr:DNA-3-methyladenine glycosylase I [Rhodopirellula sp. JC740]